MDVTGRRRVTVRLVGVQLLGNGVGTGLVNLEVSEKGGVTESEGDHRLVDIGLDLDVINDGADGVRSALGDDRGGDLPGLAGVGV